MSEFRKWQLFGIVLMVLAAIGLVRDLSDARQTALFIIAVIAFATSAVLKALPTPSEKDKDDGR